MLLRIATRSLISRSKSQASCRSVFASPSFALRPPSTVLRGFASAQPQELESNGISPWSQFPMAPPDPIIGLTEAYLADDSPDKVRVRLMFSVSKQILSNLLMWCVSVGQCRRRGLQMRSRHAICSTCGTRSRE